MTKKLISFACAVAIIFTLLATPAMAAPAIVTESNGSAEDISLDMLEFPSLGYDSSELVSNAFNYNLSGEGKLLADYTHLDAARSSSALVQELSGYITEEGTFSYALFNLSEGQIFHATLECPESAYLDYGLGLCKVADDGTLTLISECNLGTYIDPKTGKTVDEGISYIHNQAAVQKYAILVMAVSGSSETYGFKLTISIDVAGSYDRYEPNENPFNAVPMSLSTSLPIKGSISASLNTANDQDWYVVEVKEYGVFNLTAGDYVVEPYYVTDGNKLVLATQADDNYVLDPRTYYIKVYSGGDIENFSYGSYTLSMQDMQRYNTMATAFDMGDWENNRRPNSASMPRGQIVSYYKFNLDLLDKVYAELILLDEEEKYIFALTPDGNAFDSAHSPEDISPSKGLNRLIVDIDGTRGSTIYLCVITCVPMSYYQVNTPFIRTRYQNGSSTLTFTGTASNPGHSISSVIYCDASNKSSIPKTAVAEYIQIGTGTSPVVGGEIILYLNSDNEGWVLSNKAGQFHLGLADNVRVRAKWAFKYSQEAFASTTKSNVTMKVSWIADIAENNHELWT